MSALSGKQNDENISRPYVTKLSPSFKIKDSTFSIFSVDGEIGPTV